jgi:hypothetical protein
MASHQDYRLRAPVGTNVVTVRGTERRDVFLRRGYQLLEAPAEVTETTQETESPRPRQTRKAKKA